jgi:hypothetical protein
VIAAEQLFKNGRAAARMQASDSNVAVRFMSAAAIIRLSRKPDPAASASQAR